MITGLKTLSSKLPCESANPIAASFPMTCTATIVIASLCVGFTLPGMIEEPGSFSGMTNSPKPQHGIHQPEGPRGGAGGQRQREDRGGAHRAVFIELAPAEYDIGGD